MDSKYACEDVFFNDSARGILNTNLPSPQQLHNTLSQRNIETPRQPFSPRPPEISMNFNTPQQPQQLHNPQLQVVNNQFLSQQNIFPNPASFPQKRSSGIPDIPLLSFPSANGTNESPITPSLKNIISQFSDLMFAKYDLNKSGFLDRKEIYPAVCEIFTSNGVNPPTYPVVLAIVLKFDADKNGLIDREEFRRLIVQLLGF